MGHPWVVAAGGVATGRGLAAVLAAGAVGAWVGTAFLASPEASTTDAARDAVLAAASTDTVYSRVYDVASAAGWPSEFGGRSLRNRFTDRWTDHEDAMGPEDIKDIAAAYYAGETTVT